MVLEEIIPLIVSDPLFVQAVGFLALFAIFYGILQGIGRFGNKVNVVLSLVFSFFITQSPFFTFFTEFLFQLSATTVVIFFFGLFIVGALFYSYARGRDMYYEYSDPDKKIQKLEERIEKLWREWEKAHDRHDEAKARATYETIQKLRHESEFWRRKASRIR